MGKKGGSSNNQTNKFNIDNINFIVPLDDNYNLMSGSISKELLEFMELDKGENETILTDYEYIILNYFLDDGALSYILDDGSLKLPNTMVTTTTEQASIAVSGGSKKKRTKKRKSKKRKYSKKKRVQKGSGRRIFGRNKAREALKYLNGAYNIDETRGTRQGAQNLQSKLFGSTQQGAQNLQSKLFGNEPVIQRQRKTKQVARAIPTSKTFNPASPLPELPPPVPAVDYEENYKVTKILSDDGKISNFMIIDNYKIHYILSLKQITQNEDKKGKNNILQPYVNYDKSLHGAFMINNLTDDDLIENFLYYGEIKGDKILEKFKNIDNFINKSKNYSYTIRNNFTENYRSLEDVINYYEYEKVHKIPFFTRRIEKLYEKLYKIHNTQNITINDLSLRDVYVSKDVEEITNEATEDIKIITRGRNIQRLASAQPPINKINDLFNAINYTGSDTSCEISYKNLLESITPVKI